MEQPTSTDLGPEIFFLSLAALIDSRRAAFRQRRTYSFGVVDDLAYAVDTQARQVVSDGWREGSDVSILCNRRTLSDLLVGRFDPARPGPEHLFVWGGDAEAWRDLERALAGGMSQVELRSGKANR